MHNSGTRGASKGDASLPLMSAAVTAATVAGTESVIHTCGGKGVAGGDAGYLAVQLERDPQLLRQEGIDIHTRHAHKYAISLVSIQSRYNLDMVSMGSRYDLAMISMWSRNYLGSVSDLFEESRRGGGRISDESPPALVGEDAVRDETRDLVR